MAKQICLCVFSPRNVGQVIIGKATHVRLSFCRRILVPFSRRKNGHDAGAQGKDFGVDPVNSVSIGFSRRVRFRPLWCLERPKIAQPRPPNIFKSFRDLPHKVRVYVACALPNSPEATWGSLGIILGIVPGLSSVISRGFQRNLANPGSFQKKSREASGGGAPKVFQKRKKVTKRIPRARIRVSTPELAIAFRGESVSGHPGARGGPNNPKNRPESFPKYLETSPQK